MKISEREKYLLGILVAALVVVGYYEFIYVKQVKQIDGLKIQRSAVETKYDDVMNTINSLDSQKGNLKVLNAKIEDKSKSLYPELIQEKLILELDDLLKNSNLKGNLNFSNVQVQGINISQNNYKALPNSTLQSSADQYNGKSTAGNNGNGISISKNNQTATQNDNSQSKDGSGGNTAQQMTVTLNFTGSYSNVDTFIKNIESRSKRIVISNLAMSQSNKSDVSGNLTMEFYAVPKIGNEDSDYSNWLLNNKYGKDSPFGGGQTSLASTIEDQASSEQEKNDFSMIVKPINSVLPTLTIGRDNDQSRTSYLYADNQGVENLEVVFTKDKNGKYYYKYKTSKNSYPLQYGGEGIEFEPSSGSIKFNVFSSPRQDSNDKDGVNLKVINNTDKSVSLVINQDDGANPRVTITSQGTAVNVIKK